MQRIFGRSCRWSILRPAKLTGLTLLILLCHFSVQAQSQQPPANAAQAGGGELPSAQQLGPQPSQQPDRPVPGSITGTIVDQTGTAVAGAHVRLTPQGQAPSQEVVSGDLGQFVFSDIAPGPFQLTIAGQGFATQSVSATLHPGETYFVPEITLALATVVTELHVTPGGEAEQELKQQEKQRVFGVIPNFYVTFVAKPAPLSTKQKIQLAWRSSIDPLTFAGAGFVAGIQQGLNKFPQYGQGAAGYGKRFGASYADIFAGTMIGSALVPSLLKQDPRYFYKGTGSKGSRILYALGNSVLSKSDSGHWQPNYSDFLGGVIVGSLSNAYYPSRNRGVGLVFDTVLLRIGESSVAGIFQEFLSRRPPPDPPDPPATASSGE
ncbi:MAG: carboxypeptidase-like regulatory domain-containing protein [Candidatus Acidiferrales bacterium]